MDCGRCAAGHAIVAGCGHLGSRIAAELLERGCEVTLVDTCFRDSLSSRLKSAGCTLICGDISDEGVLEQAGASTAACFIAATGDDRANLESAVTVRQMNEGCAIVVRLYDQPLGERVERVLGVRALSGSFLASPAFVSAATDDSIISAFTIDGCCLSIHAASARPPGAAGHYIDVQPAALRLSDEPTRDNGLFAAVHTSHKHLYSGKRRRRNARKRPPLLTRLSPIPFLRELAGTWSHAALISKRLAVALLAVSVLSVSVFTAIGRMSPLDAVYFVVTTMTTVGYGDFNLQHAPAGLKAFGIVMMLSGAALLATLYAIIADRVLAARVEYLLGRRRVDLRGHTIVVGLGKVGYRVATHLASLGLEVVGVEAMEDSDNISSARSIFPVIVGDASRSSILSKASVDTADTILALTDDPLLNLSVALSAREHNPHIRTIVRTYDVGLAEKFRSFGLDVALSTSAIAAPAFADAAIYRDVHGSFRAGGQEVLLMRHVVAPHSRLLGKTPDEISAQMGIAVVATADAKASYIPAATDTPLREWQTVIALLPRNAIEALNGR